MYFYAPSARLISIEIMLSLLIFDKMINKKNNLKTRTKLKHTNITKLKKKKKSKLNRNKLMIKTTKTITFSTYHVNICIDMGYMFMMTKTICKAN
jgi:hypothetical protein